MVQRILPKTRLVMLLFLMLINPQNMEDGSRCGHRLCSRSRGEVCIATVDKDKVLLLEECQANVKYLKTCRALACDKGMSCRVVKQKTQQQQQRSDIFDSDGDQRRRPLQLQHQVHVGCVYQSEVLDHFASENSARNDTAEEDLVPTEDDTPIAWCIVISVLSLLPLIVLACIVIYRFVYKLPRIGREKEELTRLFQTLGYDENTEIYKKVIDFFYK